MFCNWNYNLTTGNTLNIKFNESGTYTVAAEFTGTNNYMESTSENPITINVISLPKEYSVKVDSTEFVPGTTATIQASIYYGNEYAEYVATDINKGKISFKVNGKTLKDANGKVIYAKVVNGTAIIENYQIPDTWTNKTVIQAIYSGSNQLEKMSSEKTKITVTSKELTLTTSDVTATAGSTITLTATLSDNTINNGKIVFKVNGKSIKDVNGNVIYAKVVNGAVSVEYTLPEDMKAKDYNITEYSYHQIMNA